MIRAFHFEPGDRVELQGGALGRVMRVEPARIQVRSAQGIHWYAELHLTYAPTRRELYGARCALVRATWDEGTELKRRAVLSAPYEIPQGLEPMDAPY